MSKKIEKFLFLIIFVAGYISLSVQLIAIRQLGIFVGNTAITASIIIGIFLTFLTLGYYKGAVLKFNDKLSPRTIISRGFFVASVFILIGCTYFFMDAFILLLGSIGIKINIIQTFIYCIIFLAVPPFLFGYIISIASRYLDRFRRNYTGRIMAVDTVGSVLGSLITTLVLMPFIGVNNTITLLVTIGLVTFCLFSKTFDIVKVLFVIFITFSINHTDFLEKRFDIVENNAVSTIAVKKHPHEDSMYMIINNSNSSKISKDKNLMFPYLKYIEDNFINTLPKERKYNILILGAGGFTMGLEDEFHNYTFVDIDKMLLPVAEERFLKQKLTDNKKFIVQDAYQFLNTKDKFDLIIMDVYSSLTAIPFQLLTKEYFELAKNALAKEGVIVFNMIASADFADDFSVNLDSTMHEVYPHLQRQVIGRINPWSNDENRRNIIYVYYNKGNKQKVVYTNDKNKAVYDTQE